MWKLPKHIFLSVTLRHLYGSKELTTLINRFGHCESYSFSLEVETAIAKALEETSSFLSSQIVRNPAAPSIFHSDFDNFDQYVNDISGTGSVHTANGIMLQDFQDIDSKLAAGGELPEIQEVERTKERSLEFNCVADLPDCYITNRRSPDFVIVRWTEPDSSKLLLESSGQNLLWLLVRAISSKTDQEVPSWAGLISALGKKPDCLTTIDCYPVNNHPITEYKTVQEVLKYSENATREVGQEYTITTFDLGVCMKAYPVIWNNPQRYSRHIVLIGTFHLVCTYLKMVGKKMAGTGFDDALIEAGLITCESLKAVMSRKNYGRSILS